MSATIGILKYNLIAKKATNTKFIFAHNSYFQMTYTDYISWLIFFCEMKGK